ncbi:hypothetical protein HMP06_0906 [Sphingomonas sp. HMP6]|nr:hypothetical protein HMP06_0906 [Sphingomonas sp. HMP6]
MPRLLSDECQAAFARRIAEYTAAAEIDRVTVIYHGGEPLLVGHARIVDFTRTLRAAVGPRVELDVGMQTNGLILTDAALDAFESERIAVSLSMDGPRGAHDLHRKTRKGRSSYDRVEAALERLKLRPSVFSGVIAVIDASVKPETLLSFFAAHGVPQLDFLLPDSHHDHLPPGRLVDPGLYERWLIEAFDAWFYSYPELRVRTFEALLDVIAGLPSGTDAFGFGDVSLVTLETDGTWHDLDVLKVAGAGATRLVGSVMDTSIEQVASSTALAAHRRMLTRSGLCEACRDCDIVDVCGGGSLPHRFGNGGFDNPTVYCAEMKALVAHVRKRLHEGLVGPSKSDDAVPAFDLGEFEMAETSRNVVSDLREEALADDSDGLRAALDILADLCIGPPVDQIRRIAGRAGTVAWQRAVRGRGEGRIICDVAGQAIEIDDEYLEHSAAAVPTVGSLEVALDDPWLRKPFGATIVFEDESVAQRGRALVLQALRIIDEWRPALAEELQAICSAVQFVRDPTAHPDKIVSFSDDSVPGALYVSIRQGSGLVDVFDLADSLVHEYRHQKLYLFERRHPTTVPGALVVSPWREELRPASGLLHAAFVFVELRRFWEHVRDRGPSRLHNRAVAQLEDTERNLEQAFETLRHSQLTAAGRALVDVLASRERRLPIAA